MTDETHHDNHDHGMWSDEAWDEWKDYADRVQVQVRFKSSLDAEDNDETWFIETDGAAWPKDWLNRQLVELAAADADDSCCGRGSYTLDATDRKTEWGASGALYEVVLTLSDNLLNEVVWAGIGALANKLASKIKSANPDLPVEYRLTEELARESAVWAVISSQQTSNDSLTTASVELLPSGAAVVELHDTSSDIRYTVEVHSTNTSVRLSRIRKITYPSAGTN